MNAKVCRTTDKRRENMTVHVVGLIALLIFYSVILGIGILAAIKKLRKKRNSDEDYAETTTVGRRDIGWIVGAFTMTATWCGGGYISGTAEIFFTRGLLYAQLTFGNALCLIVAGLFFAKPMRDKEYMTMLDPFRIKYGDRICALMYIPAFFSEVIWVGAISAALGMTAVLLFSGSSVAVVLELDFTICVCVSMIFCIMYVTIGGIYSVTWTDMGELLLVMVGLALCTPFIWHNENVNLFHITIQNNSNTNSTNGSISQSVVFDSSGWLGVLETKSIAVYLDNWLLVVLVGIPWQDYFQRVLSAKTARRAQILSFVGCLGCLLIALPSAMIGIAARYTDWNAAGYSNEKAKENAVMILPLALEYLTPKAVAFFGVGAVSAATMSSADASLLSIGTMFTHNVYKPLLRPKASEREMVWTIRLAIIFGGIVASFFAIFVKSVVALWWFAGDIVYVVLFPQLVCVLLIPMTTAPGALCGYVISIVLRLIAGEPSLHLPPAIRYPYFDQETNEQLFPVKTFAMLMNFASTLIISYGCVLWRRRRRAIIIDESHELGSTKNGVTG